MLFYSFDSDEENPLWPCSPRNLLPHVEPAPGEPSRPPPKGRLSQIAEAVRPGTRPAVPRRTAARARLRGRDAAVRASDSRRRLGGSGTFPSRKSLKTNETELEPRRIPRFGGRRCNVRLAGPKGVATPRPFPASFAGNRRGGGYEAAKFSYPQHLEKARNGERISQAVAPGVG